MAVVLVLVTFAVFLTVDYLVNARRERLQVAGEVAETAAAAAFDPNPVWVAGYRLPDGLHYHPGHTWARPIGPDTALVGVDDFAARLLGDVRRVDRPARGAWLRQGDSGFALRVDGKSAHLVAPVEGEVEEVNPELRRHPELVDSDPYGRGWVLKIRSADLATDLRNLLSGSTARRWMEDSHDRLQHSLMALSGTVLQDGGEPVRGFAAHLGPAEWKRLTREFLLT